jgi:hypothetical protein
MGLCALTLPSTQVALAEPGAAADLAASSVVVRVHGSLMRARRSGTTAATGKVINRVVAETVVR